MSASSDQVAIQVDSAVELLQKTELSEIRTYTLHAERASRDHDQDADVAISARSDADWLEVRCKMTISSDDADLLIDRAAVFHHSQPLAIPPAVLEDFIERVGVMSVYPYLREGAFTLATNLGVSPPVLALMRAGSVRMRTKEAQAVPADSLT